MTIGSNLEQLLTEAEVYLARIEAGQVDGAEAAMTEAIDIYRGVAGIKKQADAIFSDVQGRAKQIVADIMAETGQLKWQTEYGSAYIPAPSVSVSYDAAALDALCASDPDLATVLQPHRVERQRAGSLTIR